MKYAKTVKVVSDGIWPPVPGQGDGAPYPWQSMMAGCPLTLHAPLDLAIEVAPLKSEFAALDAILDNGDRRFMAEDDNWTSVTLVERLANFGPGIALPALDRMPSLIRLFERTGWNVVSCHLMRLPPNGVLPWHFEAQAPHLRETRVLLPLLVPKGAITLIGEEAAAYPEGTAWAGDFNFPHQVENRSDSQRIVLLIDLMTAPEVLRLLPPSITASPELRTELAHRAANEMLKWRSVAARWDSPPVGLAL